MSSNAEPVLALCAAADPCHNRAAVTLEHDLLERAQAGDGRAFQTLVAPHLGMLFRLAARASGDRALAEDAVQEALTIAFVKLHRYRPGSSLRAFLAAIALKQARTLLRTERRRRQREERAEPLGRVPEPSELLDAEQSAARLRGALTRMTPKRRDVVLLRLDAGLSHAEIALALGISEGSARVLLHLALGDLRAELGEADAGAVRGSTPKGTP